MEQLEGAWRLLYTSAFESGSLGGARPGPPAALTPVKLGTVLQVVDNDTGLLDNVVELNLPRAPVPGLSTPATLRACLRHTFSVSGNNTVRIVYDSTKAQLLVNGKPAEFFGQQVNFNLPSIQRAFPEAFRSACFDVTYLDDNMRITRGDRDELRIYTEDLTP
eukprot:TRINITY_DN8925_c0_g4_i3.p3 TRINITY_DN8925_c0_g4~~TRINITY_DN8925_c0_g4_i3.p3  ORF type:complete len:163 (+),score=15.49 TRINITY_DN8925_c0_g4_i3:167-655(+)